MKLLKKYLPLLFFPFQCFDLEPSAEEICLEIACTSVQVNFSVSWKMEQYFPAAIDCHSTSMLSY